MSGLSLEEAVLEPAFSNSENSYIAHVTTTRASITVTPSTTSSSITLPDTTTSPSNITIKVNGKEVANNSPSERISLKSGDNVISIVTSSFDLTDKSYSIAKIYTVNVIKPPVRINFDSNGGSSVDLIEVEFESIFKEPQPPVRKGYNFNGWYKDDSLKTLWNFEKDTIPAENITLYAKWKARKRRSPPSTPDQESDDLQLDNKNIITNDKKATIDESEEVDVRTIEIRSKKELNNFNVTIMGNYLKELEDDSAIISVTSDQTSFNISARDIDIENITKKLNIKDDEMDSLEIDIEIKGLDEEKTSEIRKKANESNYEVIFEPISFNITSRKTSKNGEVTEEVIDKSDNYIERVIRIPEGIDPDRVTTGVVYRADGTFTHVPTTIYEKDGVSYAKIKSLTNSIYILISNEIEVESVKNYWSRTPVNSLAKRLVIKEPDQFNPEGLITRGSFAEYITKAMGVYNSDIEVMQKFLDVDSNNEYSKAISIANDYGIISGYPDGSFKPNQTISRQEAMAMFANAMEVIKFAGEDVDRIEQYQDKTKVSLWAYESVVNVLAARVFNGRTNNTIAPLDTITYAEASTAIWNLLVESELIDR